MACCFAGLIISSSASYPSTSHSVSATGLPINGSSFDNNKQVVSTTVTNVASYLVWGTRPSSLVKGLVPQTNLVPRSFEGGERPGTHCLRMRYFPSKSWEFVFSSAYYSVNVTLDLRCMPKNRRSSVTTVLCEGHSL